MSSLEFFELSCHLEPVDPWREILIAELADIGFDSFEDLPNGFKAYTFAGAIDIEVLSQVFKEVEKSDKVKIDSSYKIIESRNWNQVWESNFDPVVLADKCYVRAPFHPSSENFEMEIIIEPKMSFGTGHHETTALMAEWLFETELLNKAVLDMGCGTGLLAMIAARRGATPVFAVDNFIYAYENTIENVERNNLSQIKVINGDACSLGKDTFDVIIANITKNVLLKDMERYVAVLKTPGVILLSGFLKKDCQELINCAEKFGLSFAGEKSKNGWLALKFVR